MLESAAAELAVIPVKKLVSKGSALINYVRGYKSELEKLETLLDAALLDVDSMSEQRIRLDQQVLEELSYQRVRLHDLSDVIAARELQKQVMSGGYFTKGLRSIFSPSNQVARIKEAREFEDIRMELNAIARDRAMIGGICCLPTQARGITQRAESSSSNILINYVIGRDFDRDKIVSMLSEDSLASGPLSVSSIFGIGGMGKTTLAWYVYDDDEIKRCFDVRFWVSMTQDFDVTKVLVEMIAACTEGELPHNLSISKTQLDHHFQRAIGGKKFLLVLDNIWDHESLRQNWIDLRDKLSSLAAGGSRVLITSRNKKVAEILSTTRPYELQDLTGYHSWLLFQKIAFTQFQEPGVEEIGMEILENIPKVPLVIRSIGGHLSKKDTPVEWNAFKDGLVANFSSSCGDEVMDTLKFSYDQLDATHKLCVTYCSLFKKGGGFFRDQMINHWIALGYVHPTNEKQSLEEAGNMCMISLANCGFLQLILDGFEMHDVIYELLSAVAGFKYKVTDSKTVQIDKRVLHLSFWKAVTSSVLNEAYWDVPSSVFKIEHLHSLIRGNTDYPYPAKYRKPTVCHLSRCYKLISNLKYLKVLDLNEMGIKKLPKFIGDLSCVGFLNLSGTEIVKLPNSITRLVNLQSLYLDNCYNLEELPKDMGNLKKMRHLTLYGCKKLRYMPMGLGEWTDIRTLDTFIVGKLNMGRLSDLNQLNHLSGSLWITVHRESKYISSSEISEANLKDKENLRELRVVFKNGTKDDERVLECLPPPAKLEFCYIRGYGGERLPSWMMNLYLPCLKSIEIMDCKSCKYLCSLGRLPHLERLWLSRLDEVEYVEHIIDNNIESELSQAPLFPSLVRLDVEKMPKLKGWWRSEQDSKEDLHLQVQHQQIVNWKPAFPKLKDVKVDNLELAISITKQQIGCFTSVVYLQIWDYDAIEQQALTLPLSSCFPNLLVLAYYEARLEVLPEGIQDLSSLRSLEISRMKNIKAIPEWIDNLISLQTLHLEKCPRLESLPHQIANLTNLTSLLIGDCPILWEKCQRPDGEYWKFIQHIPHITMYDPRESKE